ncbi:hypothetical protein Q31b_03980 [Novipirellula aureliae]|uniref:Uncharacterized protein n=1 Tax=Novipirellula aureliae TaxID=2527966 RepID=A0A5C6EBB7_9BACT|nr:hypothetical protein [Novipirellula aureliae]TWU45227.1 hypothetical protein Q31b_03980 [Novipirellula aureliae]
MVCAKGERLCLIRQCDSLSQAEKSAEFIMLIYEKILAGAKQFRGKPTFSSGIHHDAPAISVLFHFIFFKTTMLAKTVTHFLCVFAHFAGRCDDKPHP